MLDSLRVDEKSAVILLLQHPEVVPVRVGSVVDEDDLKLPLYILRAGAHFINNYYSVAYITLSTISKS